MQCFIEKNQKYNFKFEYVYIHNYKCIKKLNLNTFSIYKFF